MIDAGALDQFAAALAPSGFRREAFLPSYGMAEAVLAVAFGALGKPPRVDRPDGMASACVVCGKPLPGIDVLIADARGRPAPERVIGPIWLRGPNVIGAYLGNAEASRAIQRRDGFIDSGDLGYFDAGELVVTGRSKDLILHHGRNIWPRDVEWAAERVAPLKPGDAAAIGVEGEGTGEGDAAARRLVVLVQCGLLGDEPRDALRKRVASAVSEALGVAARVVLVGPRDLPRTSSGKLSRSRAKALWESINEQRSGTSQNHSFGRAVSAGREDR
jgi:fatty-acyl-CoA synthase